MLSYRLAFLVFLVIFFFFRNFLEDLFFSSASKTVSSSIITTSAAVKFNVCFYFCECRPVRGFCGRRIFPNYDPEQSRADRMVQSAFAHRQAMSDDKVEMHDSMGSVAVPADALYRAQTQRALDNFRSARCACRKLIRALARIKQGCARSIRTRQLDGTRRGHRPAAEVSTAARGSSASTFSDRFGYQQQHELNEVIATLAGSDGLDRCQ